MSTLEALRRRRAEIVELAKRYGASNVRVFGSARRGDDRPDSDIDVLVAMERGRTLLDLVGLEQDLTDLLGRPVDVVVEGGLSPHAGPQILQEAAPL